DLLDPGLAALPAVGGKKIGAGGEHVGGAGEKVDLAVAVEIDAVVEIVRGQELELAELARPRPAHLVGGEVAAVDHLQRVDELRAEDVGAAAVIGERGN